MTDFAALSRPALPGAEESRCPCPFAFKRRSLHFGWSVRHFYGTTFDFAWNIGFLYPPHCYSYKSKLPVPTRFWWLVQGFQVVGPRRSVSTTLAWWTLMPVLASGWGWSWTMAGLCWRVWAAPSYLVGWLPLGTAARVGKVDPRRQATLCLHLHSCGKSHFFIGKIHYKWSFSICLATRG